MLNGLSRDANTLHGKLVREHQSRLTNLILNAIRVIIVSVPTAMLFRLLSKPSDKLLADILRDNQQKL